MRFWRRLRGQRSPREEVVVPYTSPQPLMDNYRPRLNLSVFQRMVWLNSREVMQLQGFEETLIPSYVPKCLGHTSASEILQGDRPEDFAPDCWLQGHLHQFGNGLSRLNPDLMSHDENSEDNLDSDTDNSYDNISGVSSLSDNSGVDSFVSDGDDEFIMSPAQALHYRMAVIHSHSPAPPPYTVIDYDDPPPTYEEAIAQSDRRSNNSIRSSELAFMF